MTRRQLTIGLRMRPTELYLSAKTMAVIDIINIAKGSARLSVFAKATKLGPGDKFKHSNTTPVLQLRLFASYKIKSDIYSCSLLIFEAGRIIDLVYQIK